LFKGYSLKKFAKFSTPVLITLAALLSLWGQNITYGTKDISILQDGVNTCFGRVQQSFFASVINNGNKAYLSSSFLNTTEECISEVVSYAENISESFQTKKLDKRLNIFSTQVHWLHKDLKNSEAENEEVGKSKEKRFEEVEVTKERVLSILDKSKSEMFSYISSLQNFTYLFFAIFLIAVTGAIHGNIRRRSLFNEIESEALIEASVEEGNNSEQMLNVISDALGFSGMKNCQKLLVKLSDNIQPDSQLNQELLDSLRNTKLLQTPVVQGVEAQIAKNSPIKLSQKRKALKAKSISKIEKRHSEEYVNIDTTFGKVINQLSSKIFTNGIVLDINIDEKLDVFAKPEALELVFYHLLINSISACSRVSTPRKIKVKTKSLGSSAVIEISDTGGGMSKEKLMGANGVTKDHLLPNQSGIGLKLAKNFIEEFKGHLKFENIKYNSTTSGLKVKAVLNIDSSFKVKGKARNHTKDKELISLKRGKKKDLQKEINRQKIA
jgi:signal transduction histidine kinase